MPFSSGSYSAPSSSWNPAVADTAINVTDWTALLSDLSTALSTCVLKDGSQTVTANIPMGGFKLTGLAAGSASGNSLRYEQVNGVVTTAGDMLYATAAGTLARLAIGAAGGLAMVNAGATAPSWLAIGTARQQLATNAGATAAEWVASLQSLMTGTGDIVQSSGANTPARLAIGTARQVPTVNAAATALAYQNPITLGTEQASTSGTSIDFGSLPAGLRRITINYVGVSTNGTSNKLFQLGTSGTPLTTTYLGSGQFGATAANYTTGFGINSSSAADVIHGSIVFRLENSSTNTWVATGWFGASNAAVVFLTAGSVSLSGTLDIVRCTTVNGTDAFDAGAINISYE